jgi:hypothetical protein
MTEIVSLAGSALGFWLETRIWFFVATLKIISLAGPRTSGV